MLAGEARTVAARAAAEKTMVCLRAEATRVAAEVMGGMGEASGGRLEAGASGRTEAGIWMGLADACKLLSCGEVEASGGGGTEPMEGGGELRGDANFGGRRTACCQWLS